MDPQQAHEVTVKILDNVDKVVVGKRGAVQLALLAAMCGGHVLVDDVPGVGKTILAKSLAISLGCSFKRIQFTPDLLPSDVIGASIFNQRTGEFDFRPGPVMAQVMLADEVNRGTPKAQAALLEAMEESQITVDGVTHPLPKPFLVLATQNPLEHEGTFSLPEAQRDRFFARISLGYPSITDEVLVLERQQFRHPVADLGAVTEPAELLDLQEAVRGIYVDQLIKEYIVRIVDATRHNEMLSVGASPRGTLALFKGIQARTVLEGRDYALPEDVKALVKPVLGHRIILSPTARVAEATVNDVLEDVVHSIAVPGATGAVKAPNNNRSWFRG